ncbi:MAG: sigma-70 family RNA polymerase sigma factor [Myxococcota bacterium]
MRGRANSLQLSTVRRALDGNRRAQREVVHRLMPIVQARARLALGVGGRSRVYTNAEDLAQDVWVHLWADGGACLLSYRDEYGLSLEGYVGMIAARRITSLLRKQHAARRGGRHQTAALVPDEVDAGPQSDPEIHATTRQMSGRIEDYVIRELPRKGKLVFRYVFTDELSPREAADALGVKIQVVYNWQHRIRDRIRALGDG